MQAGRNDVPGIVAIGRNEGERLRRCLESICSGAGTVVYVDSGSTDGSRELAASFGAHVVELDLALPFTAARARNAGFERLVLAAPATEFVQFIDGDCTLCPGWIETGVRTLRERGDAAVACGRRRERAPERSVYNRLCDIEWDTAVGDARSCGGDALMRCESFRRAGGYDPAMIAGEEPDLCLRLARLGLRVVRCDAEMTLHDAAMTRWTQWWHRAERTGHTSAELLDKYGNAPEHQRLRRMGSALFWAVVLPLGWIALLVGAASGPLSLSLATACCAPLLAYSLLLARIERRSLASGRTPADARAYAWSCLLGKLPEVWGMLLYLGPHVIGRRARWIEYKDGPRGLTHRPRASAAALAAATGGTRTRRN